MQSEQLTIAHSLYAFYESLPDDIQQTFLQKLFQKQGDKLENLAFYFACQQAKDENEFLSDTECRDFIESLPQ
ncbi:MAG: hypothetical protein AB7S75_25460 [Desulfococcaceae bacterium]